LEQRVATRTRDLHIAADVSTQITTVLDIDELLREVTRLTATSYDLYASFVFLPTEDGSRFVWAAGANGQGDVFDLDDFAGISIDAKPSVVAMAARTRQTVVVNDVSDSSLYLRLNVLSRTRSEVAIPMLLGNRLLGIFDLESDQPNHFTDDDIRVMETLAEQIAIAVRNAQLFAEAQAAREAAEQASQVKSQFLANMSHELRTPLNAILNFSGFIADGLLGPVNDEQVEALNKVIGSSDHLLSLINDILDLTKIEVGMMDLFIQDVNINEALDSLLSTAKGLIKDKPVELVTDIEANLPVIQGDRRRIRQVMLNLLSNAVKFTPQGRITISAHYRDGALQLAVQDTGIGITDDQRNLVFETFRQAKHELSDTPGTGLGMPISKAFVEAHGGQLWFESEVGQGSTFYVTIPVETQAIQDVVDLKAQSPS
jgi:signal transduction histidine kinase